MVYSRKQLAIKYGVDRKTFSKWLRPLADKIDLTRRVFTPVEYGIILLHLGEPEKK